MQLTGRSFKERLYEHNTDMKNRPKPKQNGKQNGNNTTKLREHVWKLKDQGIDFTVKWRILDRAPTFNPITRKCRVCLKEKFYITGWSIMTVKEYELIAQAKKQPISLDICPFHHCIGTFWYLVSKKFHDHPVIIHLERLLRCETVNIWKIH